MAELTSQLKRFLKKANSRWQEEATRAKEEGGFERLDDGRYVARLTGAELTESKSGKPMIVFTYTVLEGEATGGSTKDFRVLDEETESLFWFAKGMMVFGYDPEDITFDPTKAKEDGFILNLLDTLQKEKPVVKLRLSTKNDYQNCTVEQVLEDYEDLDEDEDEVEEKPKKKSGKDDDKGKKGKKDEPKSSGKKSKKDEPEEEEVEEDEEDEDEEEEVELEVGMKVSFTWKKEELEGTIKEILEDEEKVKVKVGSKIYPVSIEKIELVDGETDD